MQITKKVQSFSFIEFPMHSIYKGNANTYIESHLNKTIFEFKGNLFDINSLNRPVNLDCLNCHHAHNRLCCDGSPYPPLTRDIEKVVNIAEDIFKETLSNEAYEQIEGFIKDQGLVDENGSFTENCGKCVFFIENESIGAHVCAIHSFAINNKKDYTKFKPKGCMMYPLDMLDLTDGSKFVFGINEDTAIDVVKTSKGLNLKSNNTGFSRWNSLDLQFVCVNKKDRKHILETKEAPNQLTKGSLPDNVFLLDSYKPMYVQEKQALITLFGEDTYRFIMKKSEELFRDILPSPI